MKNINTNQIKRFYAFIKDNLVSTIIVVVVIACGISLLSMANDGELPGAKDNEKYETETNLRFAMSDIETLNPLVSTDRDTYNISKLVYSSLFDYDNNFGLTKDLVKDYSVDSKNGVVNLSIKNNVTFHDGSKLTADDVTFTYNAILGSGSNSLYYNMAKKISSIVKTGKYKLKITFYNPADGALNNLTFPIVSSSNYSTDKSYKPIGTGQYMLSSRKTGKYYKFKGYDDYYGDVAKNRLYFQVFPNSTKAYNMITDYDVTGVLYKDFDGKSIADDKKITHSYVPSNNMEYIGFNFNNTLLNIKVFRKALAYSIDMKELVNTAYPGFGLVNDSLYYPGYLGVTNLGDTLSYDVGKANNLLEGLGLEDVNNDGYLDDDQGNSFELRILVNQNDSSRCLAAEKMVSYFDSIQIKSTILKEDWNNYNYDLKFHNFDIVIGGYEINKNDNLGFMFNSGNYMGYNNEEVSNLVNKMNTTMTITNYKKTYQELKNLLNDELPYYCICYKQYSLLAVKNMDFQVPSTYDNVYKGASTWNYKKIVKRD